jgi:hypothetical protein
VEDKVYLLTQKTPSRQTTRKLEHEEVRLSSILEVSGSDNYRLRLPNDTRIDPGLEISLLQLADLETPLRSQTKEEDEFEVEEILERRGQRYLINGRATHIQNTPGNLYKISETAK